MNAQSSKSYDTAVDVFKRHLADGTVTRKALAAMAGVNLYTVRYWIRFSGRGPTDEQVSAVIRHQRCPDSLRAALVMARLAGSGYHAEPGDVEDCGSPPLALGLEHGERHLNWLGRFRRFFTGGLTRAERADLASDLPEFKRYIRTMERRICG